MVNRLWSSRCGGNGSRIQCCLCGSAGLIPSPGTSICSRCGKKKKKKRKRKKKKAFVLRADSDPLEKHSDLAFELLVSVNDLHHRLSNSQCERYLLQLVHGLFNLDSLDNKSLKVHVFSLFVPIRLVSLNVGSLI